jgi:hypothetical protein
LEYIYTGSEIYDTHFLVGDTNRVLDKYKQLNFCSINTDNTAANKAMWEEM